MNRKSFIGRFFSSIAIGLGLLPKASAAPSPTTPPFFLTVERKVSDSGESFIVRYTKNGQAHSVVIPNAVGIQLLDLKTEEAENSKIYNTTIVGTLLECLSKLILWDTSGGKFRGNPNQRLATHKQAEMDSGDFVFPWSNMTGPQWKDDGSPNILS